MERFKELDALRGLAALTVVSYHLLLARGDLGGWLWRAPFYAGHEAVILFFVLSGFVLDLPLLKGRVQGLAGYGRFLVRRVCRIYLPYLPSVALSAAMLALLGHQPLAGTGSVVNAMWFGGQPLHSLLTNLDLLTNMSRFNLNPAVWSLVIELRVSLAFPFLAYWANRLPWAVGLGLALVVDWESAWLEYYAGGTLHWDTDWLLTCHYVGLFVLGCLLARHHAWLVERYGRASSALQAGWWGLGLALIYKHTALVNALSLERLGDPSLLQLWRLQDWVAALGVALVMVGALASPRARRLLNQPLALWLGEVSYSLYLYHLVAIVTVARCLYGHVPPNVISLAGLGAALGLAWLSWRLVERPAIALGRRLAP